jgi:hypothetical protein
LRLLKRWLKIAIGAAITIFGIILMPIPGPGGTPVTLAGLAILGSELPWAKKLMERLKERVGVLRIGKTSPLLRVGIISGLVCFYAITSVIVFRMFSN